MKRLKLFVTGAVMASAIFMPLGVFGESDYAQQTPVEQAILSLSAKDLSYNVQDVAELLRTQSSANLPQWASVVLKLQQGYCFDLSQLFECLGQGDSETVPPSDEEEIAPPSGDEEIIPPSDEEEIVPPTEDEEITPPSDEEGTLPPNINPGEGENGNGGADTEDSIQSTYLYAREILNLVNAERQKVGVAPLTLNEDLNRSATVKSKDMANQNYFSHTSPTYGGLTQLLNAQGIRYSYAGENIAMGQRSPEEVMNAWMNSSGHRANILNSNFTQLGVGYATNGNGTPYWTQHFTRP